MKNNIMIPMYILLVSKTGQSYATFNLILSPIMVFFLTFKNFQLNNNKN